jgi:hypothetical protein
VLVKWSPIPTSKWNGIALGYVLFVADCDVNLNTSAAIARTTSKIEIKFNKYKPTTYLIRGLAAYKCYKLNIAAWNSVGLGPRGDDLILNRTSQSKPSNYTYNVNLYTVNSTAIRVTWAKLDQAYMNGLLTGYLIKYQPVVNENNLVNNEQSDSVINYYDYDEAINEESEDNDLVYIGNYKPKEVALDKEKSNFIVF